MMNAAKKDFYTNFKAENSMDQGKLFRAAKKLLAKKEVPSFPDCMDISVLANDIGKFFIGQIQFAVRCSSRVMLRSTAIYYLYE